MTLVKRDFCFSPQTSENTVANDTSFNTSHSVLGTFRRLIFVFDPENLGYGF